MSQHQDHRPVSLAVEAIPAATCREAFEKHRQRITGLAPGYAAMNVDVQPAMAIILGSVSSWQPLIPQMIELKGFDAGAVEDLDELARAALWASTLYLAASEPPDPIGPLVEWLSAKKVVLLADLTAAGLRGLIDASRLNNLVGTTGHKNLGFDMLTLIGLALAGWEVLENRSGLDLAELNEVEDKANRLIRAAGHKENGAPSLEAAQTTRRQAFTLAFRGYDQVRRGLTFLRWAEGDAELLAPSLYKRGARRAKVEKEVSGRK